MGSRKGDNPRYREGASPGGESQFGQNNYFPEFYLVWFIPINIIVTFILGSALGWILIKITRPPEHLKGLMLGCCSAGYLLGAGKTYYVLALLALMAPQVIFQGNDSPTSAAVMNDLNVTF